MESTVGSRFGMSVMIVVGLITAVAATIAVVAKGKHEIPQALDFSDNWDEVLGI